MIFGDARVSGDWKVNRLLLLEPICMDCRNKPLIGNESTALASSRKWPDALASRCLVLICREVSAERATTLHAPE
ncbi:hypothetical protein [Aminobacter carboxidus]|uniref:Uncharacterized protein n=1 Tax=Aminobacter carboxidus TaxID=376165 RepID=A0ABR9GIE4_9HYPH|nr:hypothetical protein [Aminobacter carboxidus]MBE1203436.1 hypothetical protein [Aminobacter carboxidus]